MPLFQVAVIKKATKDTDESVVTWPKFVCAKNKEAARFDTIRKDVPAELSADDVEVLVVPFA